jgi:hypothetical protein
LKGSGCGPVEISAFAWIDSHLRVSGRGSNRLYLTEYNKRRWRILHTYINFDRGHAVSQLVEALRYKPEGRGFDPDGVIDFFH